MSLKQIASLALKLLGIYTIIQSLPILGAFPTLFTFNNDDKLYIFFGSILPCILLCGAGAVLILTSNTLAHKMVGDEKFETSATQLTGNNIQVLVFSILGIAMMAWAIPEISKIYANIVLLEKAGDEVARESMEIGTKAYAIGLSIQFIVGLMLFFGAKGLSSFWLFIQKQRPMSKTNT